MNKELKIDWLGFTFKPDVLPLHSDGSLYNVYEYFLEMFPELQTYIDEGNYIKGRYYYQYSILLHDDICVSYDSKSDSIKGVNVTIPSHGLERFYSLFHCKSAVAIFPIIFSRHCQISRIDVAYDDYSKRFRPTDFNMWFDNGMMLTRCRSKASFTSLHKTGDTFYLGRRTSGKVLRIYDKAYESDGEIDAIRYEMEYHGQLARNFVNEFFSDSDKFNFANLISSWFRIVDSTMTKEEDIYNNRSRCKSSALWEDFLNKSLANIIPIVVTKRSTNPSLHSRIEWFYTCKKALAVVYTMDPEQFINLLEAEEIDPKWKTILADEYGVIK